jgi:peptidoglycan/LPS O-acetylase OafA/YrhL
VTTTAPQPSSRERSRSDEPVLSDPQAGHLQRFSALDGIRAFAVMAVLLYHAGISWMGGGLLGVDVFFVLSGFLITSLLCRELTRSGTVRLGRFWAQRARRLLPGLVVLLLGVAAYAHFFSHSLDLASVRGDAIATMLYVANWHFILSDQGYFAMTSAPSPLLHTWSLAVEEQYYLIWPVVALAVVRWWGVSKLAVTAAVGAVASAALAASLYATGFSIDRIYYGTDTRAQALLVGSFLGAVGSHATDRFVVLPDRWTSGPRGRWWAVPGVLGAIFLAWAWHVLDGRDALLYRGGFLVVALAAGAVIVTCVSVPKSMLARGLSFPVLVFVGRISYGLYLYHWPLFLVIDHAHTGLSGGWLLATRLAVTFAAATLSFRFIEEPIRKGAWFRGRRGRVAVLAAALVTAAAVLVATVAPAATAVPVPRPGSTPAAERQALTAARAYTTRPVRFMLLGDSIAVTLGFGLTVDSVHRFGVEVTNKGRLGCDLDQLDTVVAGQVGPPTSECADWRTDWASLVKQLRPEVVGLLLGRWEVSDHLYQGHWVHVGQKVWDDHLAAELDQAVDIFTARGAKVVLFTLPYVDPSVESANGTPFAEDDPVRAAAFNRVVERVAAHRPRTVTLIDLNKLIDPHGSYQPVIDGITVRWADGIHISKPGGEWLQPKVLPTVAALGLATRRH